MTFNKKIQNILLLLGLSLLLYPILIHIHDASIAYVTADVWRNLNDFFIPMHNNGFSFLKLWGGNGAHVAPYFHLYEYINFKYFGFIHTYDVYFGTFFRILNTLILMFYAQYIFRESRFVLLPTIGIALIYLSFNPFATYEWNQVALRSLPEFFSILIFMTIDQYLKTQKKIYFVALIALSSFSAFFMTIDLAIVSFIGILTILILTYHKEQKERTLNIFLLLVGLIIINKLAFHFLSQGIAASKLVLVHGQTIADIFSSWDALIANLNHFAVTQSNGFYNILLFKHIYNLSDTTILIIAYIYLSILIITVVLFIFLKLYKQTYIPLFLILYSVLIGIAITVYRFNPSVNSFMVAATPRNSMFFLLGFIGFLLTLYVIFKNSTKIVYLKWFYSLLTISLIAINLIQIYHADLRRPYLKNNNDRNALAVFMIGLKENNITLPPHIIGKNGRIKEKAVFMKENKLNVYSMHYPKSGVFLNYYRHYNQYDKSTSLEKPFQKNGDVTYQKTKPKELTLSNQSNQNIIVKVEIYPNRFIPKGLTVLHQEEFDIYKGSQSFYFEIPTKEKLDLISKIDNKDFKLSYKTLGEAK